MAEVETTTEARQGRRGQPILYVLIVALVLAIAAGGGLLIWQGAESPADPSQQAAKEQVSGSDTPANGEQPAAPTRR